MRRFLYQKRLLIQKQEIIIRNLQEAFKDCILNIFNVDINSISLSFLIKNQELKKRLQKVEKAINKSKKDDYLTYKEQMFELGKIFFDFYEKNQLNSLYFVLFGEDIKKRYYFPKEATDRLAINLLEIGVEPYYYHRFKNFVPSFGLDRETHLIVPKTSVYWDKSNWNKMNCIFCLGWLIEYALRAERKYRRKDYRLKLDGLNMQILTAKKNISIKLRNYKETRVEKQFNFVENKEYFGKYIDYVDGRWEDYDNDTSSTHVVIYTNKGNFVGEIPKDLFNITETFIDEIRKEKINSLIKENDAAMKE